MSANDAKNYAKSRLNAWGWGNDQFDSLDKLWEAESNWNYKAKNKKTGAAGIPQLMGGSKVEGFDNDYCLYTFGEEVGEDNQKVYVSIIREREDGFDFVAITDDEEWKAVQEALNESQESGEE